MGLAGGARNLERIRVSAFKVVEERSGGELMVPVILVEVSSCRYRRRLLRIFRIC